MIHVRKISCQISIGLILCFALLHAVFMTSCQPKSQDIFPPPHVSVVAAVPQSPHAQALAMCLYGTKQTQSCSLAQLPYIGQDTPEAVPSVDQVMAHVAVSQPWMGTTFRQLLSALPDHVRTLLKSVTGIVIAEDMTTSGFYTFNGAIYLDPQYLWRTQNEKATLNRALGSVQRKDDQLHWLRLFRYVKNKAYVYKEDGLTSTQTRTLNDILYINAALLYHALALAADTLPPEQVDGVSREQTPLDVYNASKDHSLATVMSEQFPLHSGPLTNLSTVFNNVKDPSSDQLNLPVTQVANEFSVDAAADIYSYASSQEDMAFIFEEFMMFYNFGIERDIGIVPRPSIPNPTGSDYIVTYGQRRRIADPVLKDKVPFVVRQILPTWASTVDFTKLGTPVLMIPTQSWLQNLLVGP